MSALYDRALEGTGLSVAQFSLLRMLERAGPCSLSAFAAAAGYDRTTLNRTLRPLEEAGLVRSSAGEDRRARLVEVTDKARAAMKRAHPAWEAAQAEFEARIGGDMKALFALLGRIEEMKP